MIDALKSKLYIEVVYALELTEHYPTKFLILHLMAVVV